MNAAVKVKDSHDNAMCLIHIALSWLDKWWQKQHKKNIALVMEVTNYPLLFMINTKNAHSICVLKGVKIIHDNSNY